MSLSRFQIDMTRNTIHHGPYTIEYELIRSRRRTVGLEERLGTLSMYIERNHKFIKSLCQYKKRSHMGTHVEANRRI